ncbi:uncharacterized protein LOC135389915 [Ornithodoros turicata]|uniref:uncharacterized protein LOC135389915 n=1 Tax=Ornithodoros turicata TaxID=34597 RepID=UPI00313A2BFE
MAGGTCTSESVDITDTCVAQSEGGTTEHCISFDWSLADVSSSIITLNGMNPTQDHDRLLCLKTYRKPQEKNPLTTPSKHVVELLAHADKVFNSKKPVILSLSVSDLTDLVLQSSRVLPIPEWHRLSAKLVDFYLMLRLRIHLRKLNTLATAKTKQSGKTGSKSVGMRTLANNVR